MIGTGSSQVAWTKAGQAFPTALIATRLNRISDPRAQSRLMIRPGLSRLSVRSGLLVAIDAGAAGSVVAAMGATGRIAVMDPNVRSAPGRVRRLSRFGPAATASTSRLRTGDS